MADSDSNTKMHDLMTKNGQREIVVEFETVRLIRKRAKTTFAICPDCGSESDFVSISAAAELFAIEAEDLCSFADANGIHRRGKENICVRSLLSVMNGPKYRKEIRLIDSGAGPDQN